MVSSNGRDYTMNVKQVYEEFMKYQRGTNKPRTVDYYEQVIGDFMRWNGKRNELSPMIVDEFVGELKPSEDNPLGWQPEGRHPRHIRPRSRHTLVKYRRALRAFGLFAVERGYLEQFKMKVKKPPAPKQHLLSFEDIETLFAHVQTNSQDRDKLILALFLDTGVRAEEARNIEWKDIDLNAELIHIRLGKGDKDRFVPFGDVTRRQLLKLDFREGSILRTIRKYDGEYVPLTYQGLRKVLDRLERDTGIKCNPHALRRTFATSYVRNGGDAFRLQRIMGHSDIQTTMKYVYLVNDDLKAAHEAHGPLVNLDIK